MYQLTECEYQVRNKLEPTSEIYLKKYLGAYKKVVNFTKCCPPTTAESRFRDINKIILLLV